MCLVFEEVRLFVYSLLLQPHRSAKQHFQKTLEQAERTLMEIQLIGQQ